MIDQNYKILYFTRFVPAYRIPVLESLNERLNGELVVCSGLPPKDSSLNSLQSNRMPTYHQHYTHNYWIGGESIHIQKISDALAKFPAAEVILAEESPRSLSLPFLIRKARKRNIRTVLWGHFSSNSRRIGSGDLRDRYRIKLARSADAIVAYTDEIATQLFEKCNLDNAFVARNTLDTNSLFSIEQELAREGRSSIRKRLGLPDQPTMLFIGRLIKEKGVSRFLETCASLERDSVTAIIIGEGPERAKLEKMARSLRLRVHFLGAISEFDESAPWIYSSDVLLNPGYLGLSVNHCFALGVPVVAPKSGLSARFHSPEYAYVDNGSNGVLTPSNTIEDLVSGLNLVLDDQKSYSEAALHFARANLSIEQMVDGLVSAIQSVQKPEITPR